MHRLMRGFSFLLHTKFTFVYHDCLFSNLHSHFILLCFASFQGGRYGPPLIPAYSAACALNLGASLCPVAFIFCPALLCVSLWVLCSRSWFFGRVHTSIIPSLILRATACRTFSLHPFPCVLLASAFVFLDQSAAASLRCLCYASKLPVL